MLENLEVLCHSSIRFKGETIIYVDPFRINKNSQDADIILITHSHYDHFSEEDIRKIKNENTKIVVTKDLEQKVMTLGFKKDAILVIEPNQTYKIKDITIQTIPAYNINKNFHPKTNEWVGYLLEIKGTIYYIAGDTDITEENKKVRCDVALLPVGGTYTMTAKEAATLVNKIKPKIAIPIHYGAIVGTKEDAQVFEKELNPEIECKILI